MATHTRLFRSRDGAQEALRRLYAEDVPESTVSLLMWVSDTPRRTLGFGALFAGPGPVADHVTDRVAAALGTMGIDPGDVDRVRHSRTLLAMKTEDGHDAEIARVLDETGPIAGG